MYFKRYASGSRGRRYPVVRVCSGSSTTFCWRQEGYLGASIRPSLYPVLRVAHGPDHLAILVSTRGARAFMSRMRFVFETAVFVGI